MFFPSMWQHLRRPLVRVVPAALLVATVGPVLEAGWRGGVEDTGRLVESARLRALGLDAGYNLDHAEAIQRFREAIEADPEDPAPHGLTAATLWTHSLFRNGAVTIDDYLGQVRTTVARQPPAADLDKAFRYHIQRAQTLAEMRVRRNPNDANARFQAGAAHSFLASYIGTVEGRSLAALGAARRAYNEHQRALDIDPSRKDAGMVIGSYRYGVSTLPLPWRVLAGMAGFRGSRERGLRMLEEAAAFPSDVQTNAEFMLVLVYNREQRYGDALRIVAGLQHKYPRNRLLWLEEGSTRLRAGQPAEARRALEEGFAKLATDTRLRARGEMARWKLAYGAALVALGDTAHAGRELRAAQSGEAHEWVRGRLQKEIGKVADLEGDRPRAIAAYRTAVRIARAEEDAECEHEAATLLKTPYRRP